MANEEIDVLREMVRISEDARTEQLQTIEKLNQYNLAIIAFAGSFLSLLITVKVPSMIFYPSGLCALLSIATALWTIRPRILKGGSLSIEEDARDIRQNRGPSLHTFLLLTAELTQQATQLATKLALHKRKLTIIAVIFLALSMCMAYRLYGYA